jgi:peptide/nickel transport system substrate-binding protein
MLAIVDTNARTTALVSGEVNAIDRVDLKTSGLLKRNRSIRIHSVPGTQHYTFAMDTRAAPFNDVNVRRALKHAVNREELVEKILFGFGAVGNDHPIGSGQRYYNKDLAQTQYDPDKAKFYLKQAGLTSVDVSLSAADAAFSGAVDAAVLYQNSAKAAGINLTPVREPNDGYWSDVWMKKPWSAVYWGGRPVEDQMFSTAYAAGAAWNDSFWDHTRFNELLGAARAELDDAKRREMYYEMQAIVSDEGGVVIPMFASYVFAMQTTVATGELIGSNWDMDGERWMERWWYA